ncbi:hypothetical protein HPP05_40680 [Corallococcus exiguus]|uniref:NACHT domain-containing protein n=1 Tax=Corallococcus exiguus TaxID=83462 RepID=UPI0014947EC4|nr:hypothetical protein [Corallococcus exiguus]NPC76062.1 hypothetical protein [Corallococcus exiguus]
MPDYDLDRLGATEFERMTQALLLVVLKAPGAIIFGAGRDGAREATFTGTLDYPSSSEKWSGEWIFQAKFHDINLTKPAKARSMLLQELESELNKITEKYKHPCNNFILITNVRPSSTHLAGTNDKIAEIAKRFPTIKNIRIWGGDTICRHLDCHPGVRQSYAHLLTPGDLIQSLLDHKSHRNDLTETTRLYLKYWHDRDQFAQLTQAGESDDGPQMHLRNVFIDLELKPRGRLFWSASRNFFCRSEESEDGTGSPRVSKRESSTEDGSMECDPNELELSSLDTDNALSATHTLLSGKFPRIVLIAGPGYGKSTLTQHVAQWHRTRLLGYEGDSTQSPVPPRIPFRIELKHFAQWLNEHTNADTESYIALKFKEATSRTIDAEQIQKIISKNPTLLLLDGLDEVMNPELRNKMLTCIREFLSRAEILGADIHTISTSRPTGYSNDFNPNTHSHFQVLALSKTRAREYAKKWIEARRLPEEEHRRIFDTLTNAQAIEHTKALLTTPLQVTIVLVIIKDRGRPPAQREALFQRYWDTILSREKSKSNEVIKSEEGLLFDLHAHLGYLLHRQAAGNATDSLLSSEQFEAVVLQFLKSKDHRASEATLTQRAKSLVAEARNRLVLIVEPKPGSIGFELRSLQEFFAAVHMVQTARDTTERLERLKGIALSEHWRNTALFFVGRVARNNIGEASAILQWVCRPLDRTNSGKLLKRGAAFALEITSDGAFSVNRDLQYGALEYGLDYLDTAQASNRRGWLYDHLSILPIEDINELLKPILHEHIKNHTLKATHAWIYLNLLDFDNDISAALDALLNSATREDFVAIIAYCITAEVSTDWLSAKLTSARATEVLWGDELWRIISNDIDDGFIFSGYAYVGQLADRLSLTPDESDQIFWKAINLRFSDPTTPIPGNIVSPDDGPREALITVACRMIQRSHSNINPRVSLDLGRGQILTRSLSIGAGLSPEQAASFDVLLKDTKIPKHLRKFTWWALLTQGAATPSRMLRFVQDTHMTESEDYDHLLIEIEDSWPLIKLIDKATINNEEHAHLRSLLPPEPQITLATEVSKALVQDGATLSGEDKGKLWHAIHLGDEAQISQLLPSIHKLASAASISSLKLLNCFCPIITNQHERDTPTPLSDKEVDYALDYLNKSDINNLPPFRFLTTLLSGAWPDNHSLAERALTVLNRLAQFYSETGSWAYGLPSYVGLLFKYICHRNPRNSVSIEPLLQRLSQALPAIPDLLYGSSQAAAGEDLRRLRILNPFLHSPDLNLASAAAAICYCILADSWYRSHRQQEQSKNSAFHYIGLDEQLLFELINEAEPERFWVGASLIGCTPTNLSSPARRKRVLRLLERLNEISQPRARLVLNKIIETNTEPDDLTLFLTGLLNGNSFARSALWEAALHGLEQINFNSGITKQWEKSVGLGLR